MRSFLGKMIQYDIVKYYRWFFPRCQERSVYPTRRPFSGQGAKLCQELRMRNFRRWDVSRFAVGAAPRGRPVVCGPDTGYAPANSQHVGRGLSPAVGVIEGGTPYTENGWRVGLDIFACGRVTFFPRRKSPKTRSEGRGPYGSLACASLRRCPIGPAPSETSPILRGRTHGRWRSRPARKT